MADSFILVSGGYKLDTEQLTVGANVVERERVQLSGATAAAIMAVLNAAPGSSDYAAAVRQVGVAAAAALADGTANPTTILQAVCALMFNGTTWDRLRGDTTNGLDVDVTRMPKMADADSGAGTDNVPAFLLGVPASGGAGIVPGDATYGIKVRLSAYPSGGYLIHRTISAASTNATSVKGSAGAVGGWYVSNVNASPRYMKIYNKASAPTVGTDTPVMTILIPGNSAGAGANALSSVGLDFSTGIALAITTGVADADTGAVAANEVVVHLFYA